MERLGWFWNKRQLATSSWRRRLADVQLFGHSSISGTGIWQLDERNEPLAPEKRKPTQKSMKRLTSPQSPCFIIPFHEGKEKEQYFVSTYIRIHFKLNVNLSMHFHGLFSLSPKDILAFWWNHDFHDHGSAKVGRSREWFKHTLTRELTDCQPHQSSIVDRSARCVYRRVQCCIKEKVMLRQSNPLIVQTVGQNGIERDCAGRLAMRTYRMRVPVITANGGDKPLPIPFSYTKPPPRPPLAPNSRQAKMRK